MKNKTKFLMSVLAMTLLMTGFVSATSVVFEPATLGKATFDLGYDCYHQPDVYPWTDCKQVEHKTSWFIRKDFSIVGWRAICDDSGCVISPIWLRPAKI